MVGYDNNIALSSFASNPASNIWNVVMTELHRKYIDAAAAERSNSKILYVSRSSGIHLLP